MTFRLMIPVTLALLTLSGLQPLRGQPRAKGRRDAYGEALPDGALMRVGTLRLRHRGEVHQLRFTPDGRHLASLGVDQVVSLWDPKTGAEVRRVQLADEVARFGRPLSAQELEIELMLHRHYPRQFRGAVTATLTPDGRLLLIATPGKVRIAEVVSGKTVTRLDFKDDRNGQVALSPDAKLLARFITLNNYQTELTLRAAADGKEIHKLRTSMGEQFHSLCFSPDGKYLAGANLGNLVSLWDVATGKRLRRFETPGMANTLCFAPREAKLASAGGSGVYFWHHAADEETGKLPLQDIGWCAAAFSPDGKSIATTGPNNLILVWDIAKGVIKSRLKGGQTPTTAVAFSPDGLRLASACSEGTLHLWDLTSLRDITPIEHRPAYRPIAFAHANALLVQSGPQHTVQELDVSNGKVLKNLFMPPHVVSPGFIAVSPTGKYLARADTQNGAIHLWDLEKNKELPKLLGHAYTVMHMRFSADSRYLASLGGDSNLRIWDLARGKEMHSLNLALSNEDAMRMQLRGRVVAFNMNAARYDFSYNPVAFAADMRFFTTLRAPSTVSLWEMTTGKERIRLQLGNAPIGLFALSPDGKRMATVSNDDVVRVWDTLHGKMTHGFINSDSNVRSLAFAPGGKLLAAGGSDGSVVLYDLALGQEKRRFVGHRGPVQTLLFGPAGATILTAGDDGTLLFWDVDAPAAPPTLAARELTDARLAVLWSRLALADSAEAYAALGELAEHPASAVHFLQQQMKPAAAVAAPRLQKLLADLHHANYALRDLASQQLIRLGTQVTPALQTVIRENTSAEATRRAKEILAKLDEQRTSPENLRLARAVELLERIGTQEAITLLETLSHGAAHARLTTASGDALKRCRRGG